MKILIVSDTHRKDGNLYDVIEKEKPLDMMRERRSEKCSRESAHADPSRRCRGKRACDRRLAQ